MSGESPSVALGLSKGEDIVLVPQDKPQLAARMDIGRGPEHQRAILSRRRDSERRRSASEPLAAPDLSVTGPVPYEQWNFPGLTPGAQTKVTSAVPLTFWLRSQVR